MAHANPIPSQRIINNYLPAIADRLQQIRQHTEGRVLLTQINLEARYEDINRYLEQIRQEATPLLNITLDHRNLHHNYTIITAERDQYQNLLNEENRQVEELRHQLNEARAQVLRTDRMMTDALRDERNARREYWEIAENRKNRISELLRNNFAFQLLIQRKETQIAEHRRNAHRLMLRYNNDMDRLNRRYRADTERWRRKNNGCINQARNWKGQFQASQAQNNNLQQQILNLQQQIFVLQNNAPVNQQIRMVGYGPPVFKGYPGEDPEDFIRDLQRYALAMRINVAPGAGQAAGRAELDGLFESCLEGPALKWYNERIKGRNWKCTNLSDNLGVATLTAVRGLAAGNGGGQVGALNTAGEFRGKAAAEIGRIGAGAATGADLIPVGTWDEDWSIAGGEPSGLNEAPVAPNAAGGFPAVIIAPDIKIGQKIYRLKYFYTTVEHEKQLAYFGQLTQGDMSVEEFAMKINKIAKVAGITDDQKRQQFIRGLNPMNQYNLRLMAKFDDTLDNIIKALSEAEKYLNKKDSYSQPPQLNYGQPKHFTANEIDRIVEERVSSRQRKPVTEDDINRIVEDRISARQKKPVPNSRDAFSALEVIAERLGYPDDSPRDVESINRFIEKQIEKLGHETFYTRVLRKKPRRRTYATKKTSTKKTGKTKRHCSNCGRTGHTKATCSSKKRSSRKANLAQTYDSSNEESVTEGSETEESNSDSDSEVHCFMNSRDVDSETESEDYETESSSLSEDDEPYRCNKAKKKRAKSTKKKTKSKDNGVKNDNGVVISRKPKKDINVIQDIFRASFKSLIRSLIAQCPKELIQEIFGHLNKEYISMKDLLLAQYIPNYSPEEKEEIWKQVSEVYNDILLPLIEAVYQLQVNYITSENIILPTFGGDPRYRQQPTGLGQNILALNHAIKAYQKAQDTRIEPLQNSQLHKTQLCSK
ncbi:unnamed protein product [Rhizophagus irregularis]|nr:unnamed protein product [Rhizophagus irregularis]